MDNSQSFAPGPQTHIEPPQQNLTQEDWNKAYWFNSLQMVTVMNHKADDYTFSVVGRHFMVPGNGGHAEYPGEIANIYLDQMSKILAQDDERLEYMSDPNLMRIYYDKLIVDVRSLVQEVAQRPAYAQAPQQPQQEKAPWDAAMGERATDIATTLPPPPAPSFPNPAPAKQPEEAPKERTFDQGGNTYKLIIGKDGRKMHYKDAQLTSAAEFNKAASLL